MQRIMVFGKPGGGKSTLSRRLSAKTGIPLYPLDLIEYQANGDRVSPEQYANSHAELIAKDRWIIEGLGTLASFWSRIEAADTLIYIDLPYRVHYWWVTKRLLKSVFAKPEGWPEGSSVWKGTLASWRFLRLSPRFWTADLFDIIQQRGRDKTIHRIRSTKQLKSLLTDLT